MEKRKIKYIGLAGPAGAGKSTAAHHIANRTGFQIASFAQPIYEMLSVLTKESPRTLKDLKYIPWASLGDKTPREALQTLGTDWGRNTIHPDLWVRSWVLHTSGGWYIADDVRFPNEVEAIRNRGGVVIGLVGRRDTRLNGHPHESETQQLEHDYSINNDRTIVDTCNELDHLLEHLLLWNPKDSV